MQVLRESVILCTNPKFLPKVVSPFHIKQSMELPVFISQLDSVAERALYTLDIKRALMCYVARTKPFCKTQQLMVAFSNLHKSPSKSGIARCIIKYIYSCYAKAKRPLPIPPEPTLLINKVPLCPSIDAICKAATWSTPHTSQNLLCERISLPTSYCWPGCALYTFSILCNVLRLATT